MKTWNPVTGEVRCDHDQIVPRMTVDVKDILVVIIKDELEQMAEYIRKGMMVL